MRKALSIGILVGFVLFMAVIADQNTGKPGQSEFVSLQNENQTMNTDQEEKMHDLVKNDMKNSGTEKHNTETGNTTESEKTTALESVDPENAAISEKATETEKAATEKSTENNHKNNHKSYAVKAKKEAEQFAQYYNVILQNCSSEFGGGHQLDEPFLNWMKSRFGKDMIRSLAQAIESGNQDTNLWYDLTGNTIHVLWLNYCKDTGINTNELDQVHWKNCATKDKVVLDFTGDINLSEGWCTTEYMDSQPNGIYDCFSADLLQEMNAADIMMVNNEYVYSDRGTAIPGKDFTFRAKPERVKLLEAFGTDIAGLANNHVYDYGEEALLDTFDILNQEGIPYVGAGRNLEEAEKPVYFVANGRKIAIVAATQIERTLNYTKEATDHSAGVLKTLNPDKFVKEIQEAKANSDIVITFVHWGTEGTNSYGSDQKSLAQQFVNAGADVIVGGHTHCLQGATYIGKVPVIYSLGNFWFSEATLDTGLSQVVINADGTIGFRFIPCIQKDKVTSLVTDEAQKTRILNFMEQISTGVNFNEDGYITAR